MRVNEGRCPPNGWHFPIGSVTLEALTRSDLVKAITEYRMRSGQAAGDPVKDIDEYVCKKWPHFCIREYHDTMAPNHAPVGPPPAATLNNRVSLWAALQVQKIPPGGHHLVNQKVADERAAICLSCPRNHPWKSGCGACNATAEHILMTVRKTNRTQYDDRIFGCEVGGFDLRTMAWLPADMAKPDQNELPFLPKSCWRVSL